MDFTALYRRLGAAFSPTDYEADTRRIYELEKRVCHQDFAVSTAWLADRLRAEGFSDVERIAHRCDGVTAAYDAIMPQAWDLDGRATLDIVSPWPEGERRIADSDEIAYSAATWSGPTPEGGATGEAVFWDPEHPEKARGKWVLVDGMPKGAVNQPIARAGALGIVATDFAQGWRDPDSTHWMNGQGQWGWYYVKEDLRIPIFVITARRAMKVWTEVKNGRPVRLKGVLPARISDGSIYTVTARIPGESEEEYGIFAHLYEPFLSDDASGVAAGIQIGRMLKNSGLRLKKSLRVVFSMEHYGFMAYLALKRHHLRAAMNMDMLSTTMCRELGFPLQWRLSAPCLPFFGDLLMRRILELCAPDLRIDEMPATLSDDTMGGEPLLGVPTNWLFVENEPSPFHHSSNPIFNDVDWDLGRRVATLDAAFAAFLLTATPADYAELLPDLKRLATVRLERYRDEEPWRRNARCDFATGQLRSVNDWCPGAIADDEAEAAVAAWRLPDEPPAPLAENERIAAQMVVQRLVPGTPWSLANIPYEKRSYCGRGRINRIYYTLLDGRRTLLEALRIADASLGTHADDDAIGDVIRFLRLLAQYGYVRILRDAQSSTSA